MKKLVLLIVLFICSISYAHRDLETGTFLTRDPIRYGDGPNMYCYVHGNPITHFDPIGLSVPNFGYTPSPEINAAIKAYAESGKPLEHMAITATVITTGGIALEYGLAAGVIAGTKEAGGAYLDSKAPGAGMLVDLDIQDVAKIPRMMKNMSENLGKAKNGLKKFGETVGNLFKKNNDNLGSSSKKIAQQSTKEAKAASHLKPDDVPSPIPDSPQVGDQVSRNFGGESDLDGHSWTRETPSTQTRDNLGLPDSNTAELQAHGTVVNTDGMETRAARPLDGNAGGKDEVLVPQPTTQIQVNAVTMPDDSL